MVGEVLSQYVGHKLQKRVPGPMAVGVVDGLKVIQVDDIEVEGLPLRQHLFHHALEGGVIENAGHQVHLGLLFEDGYQLQGLFHLGGELLGVVLPRTLVEIGHGVVDMHHFPLP